MGRSRGVGLLLAVVGCREYSPKVRPGPPAVAGCGRCASRPGGPARGQRRRSRPSAATPDGGPEGEGAAPVEQGPDVALDAPRRPGPARRSSRSNADARCDTVRTIDLLDVGLPGDQGASRRPWVSSKLVGEAARRCPPSSTETRSPAGEHDAALGHGDILGLEPATIPPWWTSTFVAWTLWIPPWVRLSVSPLTDRGASAGRIVTAAAAGRPSQGRPVPPKPAPASWLPPASRSPAPPPFAPARARPGLRRALARVRGARCPAAGPRLRTDGRDARSSRSARLGGGLRGGLASGRFLGAGEAGVRGLGRVAFRHVRLLAPVAPSVGSEAVARQPTAMTGERHGTAVRNVRDGRDREMAYPARGHCRATVRRHDHALRPRAALEGPRCLPRRDRHVEARGDPPTRGHRRRGRAGRRRPDRELGRPVGLGPGRLGPRRGLGSAPPSQPAGEPSASGPESPSLEPSPSVAPTPTPAPTPVLVPDPLTGRLVTPAVAAPSPDRRHDRRPVAGPAAVRVQRRLDRLAGPRRGRDPALHDGLPGEHPRRRRAGPELALLLHRLGRRVARGLRPRRRLAAGPRHAPRRRATASSSSTPTSSAMAARSGGSRPDSPPHNLYTTGKQLRRLVAKVGAKDAAIKWPWTFAPDAPLAQRPVGGRITVNYLAQRDPLRLRPDDEHLPPLEHRREEADRRSRRSSGSPRRT